MTGVIDEHFFLKYREFCDSEDAAFDELEHAYEDGDRSHFDQDYATWQEAVERRQSFLERQGVRALVDV